ncbi:hypothetical protein Tco_0648811 [Tanacetum coccineum]
MWCLFDSTPSGWCKMNAYSTDFGESLSKAWTRFKDLLQKFPRHGIDRWLQIQIFYDHVSFYLKGEIDHAIGGKLRDKNADESWEIIKNLALYDHEGWNDSKDHVKPIKAITISPSAPKTPDWRLLELEDQINFLLKGSQPTPKASSTHTPQAYAKLDSSDPLPQGLNELPRQSYFTFPHTERMERFENVIFKQREEINDRMAEIFGLLKELAASRTSEKILISDGSN